VARAPAAGKSAGTGVGPAPPGAGARGFFVHNK
jgi:hypothetical protein